MSTAAAAGTRGLAGSGRLLEILSVLLLGLATVGSAWCAYEASQWNGEQADLAREASDLDIEATRLSGIATQRVAYDAGILSDYAQAVASEQDNLVEFYRSSLIRPQFLPLVRGWEAQVAAGGTPDNLFEDEAYLQEQYAESLETRAAAETVSQESQSAGRTSGAYVQTTIFFAIALFFAGVTSTFRTRGIQILLLMVSSLTVAVALARLADLPVA